MSTWALAPKPPPRLAIPQGAMKIPKPNQSMGAIIKNKSEPRENKENNPAKSNVNKKQLLESIYAKYGH